MVKIGGKKNVILENSTDRRVNKVISQLANTNDFQEIRDIRAKILKVIPNARAKNDKYLAAVATYYLKGELNNQEDRFKLNKLLLELHKDNIHTFDNILLANDFDGASFDKLKSIIDLLIPSKSSYDSFEKVGKIQDVGGYRIFRLDNFEDAKYVSQQLEETPWCIFNDEETFFNMSDGCTVYVCVKNGYESIRPITYEQWFERLYKNRFGEQANELKQCYEEDFDGEYDYEVEDPDFVYSVASETCCETPFVTQPYRYKLPPCDEYGLSMLVVMVGNINGDVNSVYSRHNLPNMLDGDIMDENDLSNLIGTKCKSIFAPNKEIKTEMNIDNLIKKSLNESISNFLLTESFNSNKMHKFFSEHGGVNKEYKQGYLSDLTDYDILYYSEFPNYNKAVGEKNRLIHKTKTNHYTRSQYDMACLFKIYVANDGCACLVGIDRNSVKTGTTWAGETDKKSADRFWRQQTWNPYDDTNKYHYSERGYGQDFGMHTNDDYKNKLSHLKKTKNNFDKWNKHYGDKNKGYDYDEWRGKELERAQEYIRNHQRYDGRNSERLKILRSIDK